jgi:uncharacterized protein (DUF1499 family)
MSDTPRCLEPCPGTPNCVSSQAERRRQWVAPFSTAGSANETLSRLRMILESMGRVRVTYATDSYIHAEFTSLVFRFVDDLELLLDREQKVVHVRSASRVGTGDLGANRRRVENLRRRLGGS